MNPLAALTVYLASVLSVIAPTMREDRRTSIAADVATITLAEPRAFDDDDSGQKTGLLLLALPHLETGRSWARWVDDGSCNDPKWRAAHALWMKDGDCDGGKAWSMWQVHVPGDSVEEGKKLVSDRKNAVRAALEIARRSLQSGKGLCGYSGETYPRCKLASMRLETARNWVTKFPFRPEILLAGHDANEHAQSGVE